MPTVRSSLPTVSGQLPPEAIRRVALRSLGQVHHCYVQALAERPTVAGRVVIRLVIDGTGVVIASEVTRASMRATEPGRCIAAAVRRWRFPAPADGDTVTVSAPFDLALDDEAPQRGS
jgi:TonB family protein